ncbi:DNA topoisomerase IV subunit A [Salibacterium qingdaonense]|uniref:DNA topoisomerase 4 subunit A n=1 Tax=Salibacterium qingdaonense TaxID=266892 RepID=A0A1I4K5A2_9BACI|nr:DNA topoisomerase IV subunit A [Salibacterium qingdaonense]SFL73948.1 DNA topoisomerase IV subunit A [Salibacterium qingdaonense]
MTEAEKHLDLPLEEVLGDRFGRYSKYIIQERALPDARDGLKPVQRRILYAMLQDGNTADKPFRKAAKTVGNVIGNYHPHGDSSVYEAMVRMSQDWKGRHPLVEMHGNNGSIDGDPPAAMRYTEARLSSISVEMLQDIEKNTVEYIPNFDDSIEEPVVLPAMYPNLLVNGSTGISSGYATDIPPHQLGEVIDAALMEINNPACTVDDLMTVMKGPDFPTGGIVQGTDGIKKAYETGRGKVVVRSKTEIETLKGGRKQIAVTELPYEVVKSNLVKRMDEIRFDKKVEGIAEVRDDTDRTGLRIVIELKKEADPQGVLNYLYKNTDLQVSYNFNMVAIHNKTPQLLGLKQLLQAYISHQKEVVTNRSQYELNKAERRQHIVEGLKKAISVLDQVIEIIRGSNDKRDAKTNLTASFDFTEEQAEAIVTLQLYRLTNTDITTLEKEAEDLAEQIEKLRGILASESKLLNVIKDKLAYVKKTYNEERRSVIEEEIEELKIDLEVIVPSENVIVSATKEGYIKRTSYRSYSASNEEPPGMKESDDLLYAAERNTTDTLLLFTEKGQYVYMPVHELSDIRWKDNGQHIGNIVPLEADDSLVRVIPVSEFSDEHYLTFFTKNGVVKKTVLSAYQAQRYSRALVAVKLKENDRLVNVDITDGSKEIFIATNFGYGLRFAEEEVTPVGQRAAGVKGIDLKTGDSVVNGFSISPDGPPETVIVTHRGAVKKMPLKEFDTSSRAKRGLVMLRELKQNPHLISSLQPWDGKENGLRIQTETGALKTEDVGSMRRSDRYSNGSFVIDTKELGTVTDAWPALDYQSLQKANEGNKESNN